MQIHVAFWAIQVFYQEFSLFLNEFAKTICFTRVFLLYFSL
jgi:hypothetical protein